MQQVENDYFRKINQDIKNDLNENAEELDILDKMIIPPPEARSIMDKTAFAVFKRGDEFEEVIRENERDNIRFSFLNFHDPFHAYYKLKLICCKKGIEIDDKLDSMKESSVLPAAVQASMENDKKTNPNNQKLHQQQIIPERPKNLDFHFLLPAISPQDYDVVKLTALFVAKNGRVFMSTLAHKEQNNPQFDFLKGNHSLNSLFSKLVEQYSKLLEPSEEFLLEPLRIAGESKHSLLEDISKRVDYNRYEMTLQKMAQQNINQSDSVQNTLTSSIAAASLDWHDFVVVECIEFTENDKRLELPSPITIEQIKTMSLTEKRELFKIKNENKSQNSYSAGAGDEQQEMEIELESNFTNIQIPKMVNLDKSQLPTAMRMKQSVNTLQQCPLCSQMISANELEEHMRIELLDPKHKEQKERALAKQKYGSNLTDADVSKNLTTMMKQRGEGSTLKPTANRVIWDGRSDSVKAATKAAQTIISAEEYASVKAYTAQHSQLQSSKIHQLQSSVASASTPHPPTNITNTTAHVNSQPLNPTDSKKIKLQDSFLIPESEFIAQCPGPIRVFIATANHPEKTEFKLNGQTISLTLSMTDTIYSIKQRLESEVTLPSSRQKLSLPAIPNLKNEMTVAYYNIGPDYKLHLGIRERGGRK